MEHQIQAFSSRESSQKLTLEEMLRETERKRAELDTKLAEENRRHQEFKKNLQEKVELLKTEV